MNFFKIEYFHPEFFLQTPFLPVVSNLASDFCQHAILEVWNLWVSLLKSQNDFFAEGKRLSETQRMQRRNFRISYQVVLKIETVYANTSQNTHTQWLFYPTHSNICCTRITLNQIILWNSVFRPRCSDPGNTAFNFEKNYFLRFSDACAPNLRTFNVELRAYWGALANIWCEIRNREQKCGL